MTSHSLPPRAFSDFSWFYLFNVVACCCLAWYYINIVVLLWESDKYFIFLYLTTTSLFRITVFCFVISVFFIVRRREINITAFQFFYLLYADPLYNLELILWNASYFGYQYVRFFSGTEVTIKGVSTHTMGACIIAAHGVLSIFMHAYFRCLFMISNSDLLIRFGKVICVGAFLFYSIAVIVVAQKAAQTGDYPTFFLFYILVALAFFQKSHVLGHRRQKMVRKGQPTHRFTSSYFRTLSLNDAPKSTAVENPSTSRDALP